MTGNKTVRVCQDSAIRWAFYFMGIDSLTKEELWAYLEILRGILPENHILFGVRDALGFVLERYPTVFKEEDGIIYYTDILESKLWFNVESRNMNFFKAACEILTSMEEITDEIKTTNNMCLKKTI